MIFPLLLGTVQDWNYYSNDTNVNGALKGPGTYTPRGKMICGSAGLNSMFYVRGNPYVYDAWENDYGCEGWSYEDVLPYFKMLENNTDLSLSDEYHGRDGPMKIGSFYEDYGTDLILNGVNECGYPIIPDINVPHGPSVTRIQGIVYNGRRYAPCKAYVNANQHKNNLKIMKCATVFKVLFDENRVAVAVLAYYNGQIYKINARREIILSAGAFGTPVILQLSGIGRADDLNSLGVSPVPGVPELDVGHNLWDHLSLPLWFTFNGKTQTLVDILEGIAGYYREPTRTDIFTGIGGASIVAYFDVPISNGTAIIECIFFLFEKQSLFLNSFWSIISYNDEIQSFLSELNESNVLLYVTPSLVQPKSHGSVKPKTTDHTAFDNLEIFYNYLSDPDGFDQQALVEAMALIQTFPNCSQTWKNASAKFVRLPLSACDDQNLDENSDEYRKCYLSQGGTTMYHPVGTCRMGPEAPAVCNPQCEVHGVFNLSVADASL